MAQAAAVPARRRRTVRDEIVAALAGIQATPRHLATQTGLTVRVVRVELEMMGREGVTTSKTHRSGEVLYRLRDAVDPRWDAFRSPSLN